MTIAIDLGNKFSERATPGMKKYRPLFVLSALLLFVELAVIRWTVANVLYLGYFSNFVMLYALAGLFAMRRPRSPDAASAPTM